MKHTISILVKNESGVLSRVSNLFSSRGYKIESITMAPGLDEDYARATITTFGDDLVIEQITRQLNKLIPVINVSDIGAKNSSFELVFIKLETSNSADLLKTLSNFDSKIIEKNKTIYTIQVVCEEKKYPALIKGLSNFEIIDIVRSGAVAI